MRFSESLLILAVGATCHTLKFENNDCSLTFKDMFVGSSAEALILKQQEIHAMHPAAQRSACIGFEEGIMGADVPTSEKVEVTMNRKQGNMTLICGSGDEFVFSYFMDTSPIKISWWSPSFMRGWSVSVDVSNGVAIKNVYEKNLLRLCDKVKFRRDLLENPRSPTENGLSSADLSPIRSGTAMYIDTELFKNEQVMPSKNLRQGYSIKFEIGEDCRTQFFGLKNTSGAAEKDFLTIILKDSDIAVCPSETVFGRDVKSKLDATKNVLECSYLGKVIALYEQTSITSDGQKLCDNLKTIWNKLNYGIRFNHERRTSFVGKISAGYFHLGNVWDPYYILSYSSLHTVPLDGSRPQFTLQNEISEKGTFLIVSGEIGGHTQKLTVSGPVISKISPIGMEEFYNFYKKLLDFDPFGAAPPTLAVPAEFFCVAKAGTAVVCHAPRPEGDYEVVYDDARLNVLALSMEEVKKRVYMQTIRLEVIAEAFSKVYGNPATHELKELNAGSGQYHVLVPKTYSSIPGEAVVAEIDYHDLPQLRYITCTRGGDIVYRFRPNSVDPKAMQKECNKIFNVSVAPKTAGFLSFFNKSVPMTVPVAQPTTGPIVVSSGVSAGAPVSIVVTPGMSLAGPSGPIVPSSTILSRMKAWVPGNSFGSLRPYPASITPAGSATTVAAVAASQAPAKRGVIITAGNSEISFEENRRKLTLLGPDTLESDFLQFYSDVYYGHQMFEKCSAGDYSVTIMSSVTEESQRCGSLDIGFKTNDVVDEIWKNEICQVVIALKAFELLKSNRYNLTYANRWSFSGIKQSYFLFPRDAAPKDVKRIAPAWMDIPSAKTSPHDANNAVTEKKFETDQSSFIECTLPGNSRIPGKMLYRFRPFVAHSQDDDLHKECIQMAYLYQNAVRSTS